MFKIPTRGDAPDEAPLNNYLAAMPGSRYIGDQWRREPLHLVAVEVQETSWPFQAVAKAFPPFAVDGSPHRVVFVIPTTLAEILVWYSDEYMWMATDHGVVDNAEHAAQITTLLWGDDDDCESVYANTELLFESCPESVTPLELAQAAWTLIREGAEAGEAIASMTAILTEDPGKVPL